MWWIIGGLVLFGVVLLLLFFRAGSLDDKRWMKQNCSHRECQWECNRECPEYDPIQNERDRLKLIK